MNGRGWKNETNGQNKPNLWNCNWWQLGKFRNLNPSELSSTFDINYGGVDYPVLRLAEIYLLKAEAQIMPGPCFGRSENDEYYP